MWIILFTILHVYACISIVTKNNDVDNNNGDIININISIINHKAISVEKVGIWLKHISRLV